MNKTQPHNLMKKLTSLLLAIGVLVAAALAANAQAPLQYRVDDLADLLAITIYGSDAKVTAWVGGNTTRDDGLGGVFYYDGTSTAATNIYAVFKPTFSGVPSAGRWFKLPTSVAWQNTAVTVGDETTYGWRFMRGAGQTNFFGIGADNSNAYLQTWSGKGLHVNNVGNSVTFHGAGTGTVIVGDDLTVTNQLRLDAVTASLPLWVNATKDVITQSVAASKTALGIQAGSGTTSGDGTVTNTFATAFSSAPKVVAQHTGAPLNLGTNAVTSVTATTFVLDLGSSGVTFDYIAIGAP